jgi:hypothetical protein
MPSKVFISYRRDDAAALAIAMRKLLSPPPDLQTAKRIRISINEPQFVADDGSHILVRGGL